MLVFAYLLLMILKLKDGESIEFISKISGTSVDEIKRINGYLPKSGQYFFIPRNNIFIIKECDNLLTIQRKTKLSAEAILKRVNIEIGKIFYF